MSGVDEIQQHRRVIVPATKMHNLHRHGTEYLWYSLGVWKGGTPFDTNYENTLLPS